MGAGSTFELLTTRRAVTGEVAIHLLSQQTHFMSYKNISLSIDRDSEMEGKGSECWKGRRRSFLSSGSVHCKDQNILLTKANHECTVQHCTPRAYQTKPSHVFQCVISLNSKRLNSVIATLEGILMCRNCREALHWSTPCKVMSGGSRGMQGWNLDCKIYVGGLHEEANK